MKKICAGVVIGAVNGLFGAGGGIVAVLALVYICGYREKRAHATAISVILPLSLATAVIYAINGSVDWHALLFTAPALVVGSIAGAKLTGKLSPVWLERIFSLMMAAAGVWMLL